MFNILRRLAMPGIAAKARMRECRIAGLAILIACCPDALDAQTIVCLQDPGAKADKPCTLKLRAPLEPILLRIDSDEPLAKPLVKFKASRGSINKEVTPEPDGIVRAQWNGGRERGTTPVTIQIEATSGGRTVERTLLLEPPPDESPYQIQPAAAGPAVTQFWYEGQQLPLPTRVRLAGVPLSLCARQLVVFKALGEGATTFPDSVWGRIEDAQCVADTRWKLGSTVGEQFMRASLPGNNEKVTFRAQARRFPWFAVGLAATAVSRFATTKSASESV